MIHKNMKSTYRMLLTAILATLLSPHSHVLCIGEQDHMRIEALGEDCCGTKDPEHHEHNVAENAGESDVQDIRNGCLGCNDILLTRIAVRRDFSSTIKAAAHLTMLCPSPVVLPRLETGKLDALPLPDIPGVFAREPLSSLCCTRLIC